MKRRPHARTSPAPLSADDLRRAAGGSFQYNPETVARESWNVPDLSGDQSGMFTVNTHRFDP